MRSMFVRVPELTGYASVRHVEVSLPFVAELIDGEKYYMGPKRLEGSELYRAKAPSGPTLRSLVKLALRCQSAEQMGQQLKKRFEARQRYRGIDPNRGRQARAEAELERLLGDPVE
jgi:hypothetical protein